MFEIPPLVKAVQNKILEAHDESKEIWVQAWALGVAESIVEDVLPLFGWSDKEKGDSDG